MHYTVYIILKCELGTENEVVNEVKKVPGVLEVSRVSGIHNIMVRLSVDSIDTPKELIKSRIKKMDKIISSITLVVTNEHKENLLPNQISIHELLCNSHY